MFETVHSLKADGGMTMRCLLVVGLLTLLLALSVAEAQEKTPDLLLKDLTEQILDQLLLEEESMKVDPAHTQQVARMLVDEFIIPHIDMKLMSRWIVGKSWRKATAQQRQQFMDEFTGMLIRTYAGALIEFRGKSVTFKPFHHDPKRKDAVVRAEFFDGSGAPPIPVLFRVRRDRQEEWKVFDIIVDGISLVKNYRSSFGAEIRKVGFDGLIRRLSTHNRVEPAEEGSAPSMAHGEG